MANERLKGTYTRWLIAFPEAFDDWRTPTVAELNARDGLVFEITCAVNQDGSNFDLGDSDTDDSLTFCQEAGAANRTTENPDIVWEVERSRDRDDDNTANTAFSLLAWPDVEYFAILSVGEEPTELFSTGDRIKMARVATDYGVDAHGNGENIRLSQTPSNRDDVNWNYEVVA